MDNFREEVAVRRNAGLYGFLYALAWVAMVIFALIAIMGLSGLMSMLTTGFNAAPIIMLVVFGGLAFLIFRSRTSSRANMNTLLPTAIWTSARCSTTAAAAT